MQQQVDPPPHRQRKPYLEKYILTLLPFKWEPPASLTQTMAPMAGFLASILVLIVCLTYSQLTLKMHLRSCHFPAQNSLLLISFGIKLEILSHTHKVLHTFVPAYFSALVSYHFRPCIGPFHWRYTSYWGDEAPSFPVCGSLFLKDSAPRPLHSWQHSHLCSSTTS